MSYKKMENNLWLKWPMKSTPVGEVIEGPIAELRDGKFGAMCLVAAAAGETLIAGKSFYQVVCEHMNHGEDDENETVWRVKVGDRLRLTYGGLQATNKGNAMKLIAVEHEAA